MKPFQALLVGLGRIEEVDNDQNENESETPEEAVEAAQTPDEEPRDDLPEQ